MRKTAFTRTTAIIRRVKNHKPSTAASNQQGKEEQQQVLQGIRNNNIEEVEELGVGKKKKKGGAYESSWWIPHPKNGIYYPKGHEWVMDDIPKGASSFPKSYWLRSSEGFEDINSDHHHHHHHPSTCAFLTFDRSFLDL